MVIIILIGWIGAAMVVTALVSALATFLILAGVIRVTPTPAYGVTLLAINAALVLGLAVIIAWEARVFLHARKANAAVARLHTRIVTLFSGIAAVPAILIAIALVLGVLQLLLSGIALGLQPLQFGQPLPLGFERLELLLQRFQRVELGANILLHLRDAALKLGNPIFGFLPDDRLDSYPKVLGPLNESGDLLRGGSGSGSGSVC